ncbi:hypothetical protein WI25_26700 [Burkholderia cepacia]|nr:hypothetical protein WI25_26700 [Burkholderia cepacia]
MRRRIDDRTANFLNTLVVPLRKLTEVSVLASLQMLTEHFGEAVEAVEDRLSHLRLRTTLEEHRTDDTRQHTHRVVGKAHAQIFLIAGKRLQRRKDRFRITQSHNRIVY